ncbi:MAG: cytochrome-c peroxidase [Balneola sp.]|nr:MAG: cytochrome-c peroxidase [Balneola sp.]
MKKQAPILLLLTCFLFSCADEILVEDEGFESTQFTEAEMVVLNKALNLDATPFNYSNIQLPKHYRSSEANESDNTPENNPITDMGATLGRVLFYDKNLSANNTISCASCHEQSAAFSDPRKFSIGLNGETTRRNSMTLINSRFYENQAFFWDERAVTLEEQVLLPIQDHIEMGMDLKELENKLQNLEYYPILFQHAFGSSEVTSEHISKALSQFTRSIVSFNSKFDEGFIAAGFPEDEEQMPDFPNFTAKENLGMDIFYRGRNGGTCLYCHGTPQHVNDIAKNNGLDLSYLDNGKGEVTGISGDDALFKVPSLRNIAKTAPYMHDGRFETLREVVDHYSDNVQDHPNLNFRLKTLDDGEEGVAEVLRLGLNEEEKEALVAFLHTLTDEKVLTDEKYSNPFKN